jgi:regulator of protease activity HflC (stomatin/prohibitin superfamily)
MDFVQVFVPLIMIIMVVGVGLSRSNFRILGHERLVIYRLGKPVAIHMPGRVMVIPFIESGVKYDVSDEFNAKLIDSYLAQGMKLRPGPADKLGPGSPRA